MTVQSEHEHRRTKAEAEKFERAIAAARGREPSPDLAPRIHHAMIEALGSELAVLREDLEDYERLASQH